MIKIIDMDKLFDKYISDYVYQNIGKIAPDEIENNIPRLYEEFGDQPLTELEGKTPNSYYIGYTGEQLLQCLIEHLKTGVEVSDFLCEAIQNNPENEKVIANQLKQENDEELTLYLMNMLCCMGSSIAVDRYLEFILWDYTEPVKELATELLCETADKVKDAILNAFNESSDEVKVYLTQVLSYCKPDDAVFSVLINEFILHFDQIPVYAGYLARYGDERALPFLITCIENDKINYQDFEELRYAIEALGGTYDKKRDFTADKIYKKIRANRQKPIA